MMQRLYSTFPGSLPGVGLLVLRASLGISLLVLAASEGTTQHWMVEAAEILAGLCLILGYATPMAAAVQILIRCWVVATAAQFDANCLIFGAVGVSLILLGPGAWSVDARLYGRRRVEIVDHAKK